MLEQKLKPKVFKNIGYSLGALMEVLGFGFLFGLEQTSNFVKQYYIIVALFIIVTGYWLAVSVRRK